MAGSRRILARLASGGVVVVGAVVGFKLVGLVGTGSAAGIPGLTQTMVYAAEDGEGGLVPVAAKGIEIQDPRKPQRFLVWSQASFEGEINQESVRTLLARGQAASLEHRLGEASKARFRQDIAETERELRALARLVDSELARVKLALRERPERHIVIRANPRTADPRWPEVQGQQSMLQRSQSGIVIGEALAPRDSALIYFVIHWDEWPVLKRLQDRFHVAVQGRREAAARWVTDEFQRRGMGAFRD
jgi:hypothetical protein